MNRLLLIDGEEAQVRNMGLLAEFIAIYDLICHNGDPWIKHPQTHRDLDNVIEDLTPNGSNLYDALCAIYGDLIEDMTLMVECIHDWERWIDV